jgi:hypothetical protein
LCLFSILASLAKLSDFLLGLSSDLLNCFLTGLFSLTHQEDFFVALKVRF